MDFIRRHGKRFVLESLGWILVLVGIAALILPGPGILTIFAGMALLATQYEWAEKRLDPIRKMAYRGARDSVKTWPRIIVSLMIGIFVIATGVVWGLQPATPAWWPLPATLWLPGGWATGGTMIASGIFAMSLVVFSYFKFRENKQA